MSAEFEVQTYTFCDGWINTWLEDDKLRTFPSEQAANQALDEFFDDVKEAGLDYSRDDYRVVRNR